MKTLNQIGALLRFNFVTSVRYDIGIILWILYLFTVGERQDMNISIVPVIYITAAIAILAPVISKRPFILSLPIKKQVYFLSGWIKAVIYTLVIMLILTLLNVFDGYSFIESCIVAVLLVTTLASVQTTIVISSEKLLDGMMRMLIILLFVLIVYSKKIELIFALGIVLYNFYQFYKNYRAFGHVELI